MNTKRILIIKLGALGDFVQAIAFMNAIASHHNGYDIDLLTRPAFAGLGETSKLFADIIIDESPKFWELHKYHKMRKTLSPRRYSFIYDLQTSDRSSRYRAALGLGYAPFSGIAKNCSHPHDNKNRNDLHTNDRIKDQLSRAGIDKFPPFAWETFAGKMLAQQKPSFDLPKRYCVLLPTAGQKRPEKIWGVHNFAKLANCLIANGITPVLCASGSPFDKEICAQITQATQTTKTTAANQPINLAGQTDIPQLAQLLQNAQLVVGGDSGPAHLAAVMGARLVVLFFKDASDANLCAPRGDDVTIIQSDNNATLGVSKVAEICQLDYTKCE